MAETPVIVISSCKSGVGKTTVALNLAAALWSDGYKIKLFAPNNEKINDFTEKRIQMNRQCNIAMPLPEIITSWDEEPEDKTVVIAVIPSADNEKFADVFYKAHTLISLGCEKEDFNWSFAHPYINLIWQAKKNTAARGIKYLNWIVVQNKMQNDDLSSELMPLAKQFGFRIAEPLRQRGAYRYTENGYCTADMAKYKQVFKMSMDDVYARREILNLTDDLWKHK
jgi:hypothetical protein